MQAFLESMPIGVLREADPLYVLCLLVFGSAVIVYVVYGGFRAVVWTDVMQGIIMFLGVLVMLGLVLHQTGGLERATRTLAKMTSPVEGTASVALPAGSDPVELKRGSWLQTNDNSGDEWIKLLETTVISSEPRTVEVLHYRHVDGVALPEAAQLAEGASVTIADPGDYKYGRDTEGVYLSAPGPNADKSMGFLSITLALSFFFFWPFGTLSQPSNMVRLMAFKDSQTLRKAIVTISIYFSIIYFFLSSSSAAARCCFPAWKITRIESCPSWPRFSRPMPGSRGWPESSWRRRSPR